MLETLYSHKPVRARHISAPMRAEREAYLQHLYQQGTTLRHIRNVAAMLLNVLTYLPINPSEKTDPITITQANREWTRDNSAPKARTVSPECSVCFHKAATGWLKFLGLLATPNKPPPPYGDTLNQFASYLLHRKRLVPSSIASCTQRTSLFLRWSAVQRSALADITSRDVARYLDTLKRDGLRPATVATDCQRLRTFFTYLEIEGFIPRSIAAGIPTPITPRRSLGSKGPRWVDVRRLLCRNVRSSADIRARAIIVFCAIYGLRGKEVLSLTLDDFDWREECFAVRRAKGGRIQRFPLCCEAGEALLHYLKSVRPRCSTRAVFVSPRAPHKPFSPFSLRNVVATRMHALGIVAPHYSTHGLRHSCATELLNRGIPLAEIADFLGHSNTNSVSVYAKSSASAIREVSRFGLADIL